MGLGIGTMTAFQDGDISHRHPDGTEKYWSHLLPPKWSPCLGVSHRELSTAQS